VITLMALELFPLGQTLVGPISEDSLAATLKKALTQSLVVLVSMRLLQTLPV